MQTGEDLNTNLINSLNESIKHPFFIIDLDGNIISFNKETGDLFFLKNDPGNIFDLFDEDTSQSLNELIEQSRSAKQSAACPVKIILKSEKTFSALLTVNIHNGDPDTYVFCSLKPDEKKISFGGVTEIEFKLNDLERIIYDKSIITLINKIKTLYPFTYIGKEKIRSEIDELNNLFWIKDINSNYAIVNNKFAGSLGAKAERIEGKAESLFLPSHLHKLFSSINNYVKDSHNCIIFEGIPLQGLPVNEEHQIIQIPLSNTENELIATIGFSLQKAVKEEFFGIFESAEYLLSDFPKAAVLIDNKGLIRNTSREFCKLIQGEFADFQNRNYAEILPGDIAGKVKDFFNSPFEKEEFDIKSRKSKEKYPGGFHIFLNRIFAKEHEPAGMLLLIEDYKSSDDLEKIINDRGRMFEILIKNNPEPIFIYDTDNLRFLEVNDAALSLYGYRRDEFLQMDLTDLYTPEDIQTLLDSSNAKTKEGQFSGPYRHKKKDGSSVFVEISKINFKFNENDAHFNVIKDITEKLELEKKNQLFKAAFDNTENLLFVTDPEGFITYYNKPAIDTLGYSKNELESTSFASLVKNEERATINTSIFQSHFKEVVSLTMEMKRSSGEFIEVELTATPVLDFKSEVDSFIIVGKYKKPEEIHEVPKEEISEPALKETTVTGGGESAESSAFISSLFHEILTPINVILGFVQELSESIENVTPEQKEAVDIISQNRNNLLGIMNSIAEYSSIQKNTSEIKVEEVAITEIIDALQEDFNEISSSRGIDFAYGKISSSLKFESDKQKFMQFTSMLLKITAAICREKKIYFSSYHLNDSSFALSVKDSYSSASKHLVDNLAMLFNVPEEKTAKDFGISKLTLRFAKALLTLLKGKFEVLGKSSDKPDYVFVFPVKFEQEISTGKPEQVIEQQPVREAKKTIEDVPPIKEKITREIEVYENIEQEDDIAEEEIEEISREEISRSNINRFMERLDLSQLSCLYIEDQVDSQILFKVQMKELKQIKFAVSFEEALPLLDNGHFDFIVMDINLQGEYNGLDALKIIHKMPGYETIPIVAVTAYVLPGDKEKFIATGFNDFISKPIFREKMIDSLEKIFLMQM
ncbi:MAG: PAS domain S-box protein [Ignavibacteriaceae bacterium]